MDSLWHWLAPRRLPGGTKLTYKKVSLRQHKSRFQSEIRAGTKLCHEELHSPHLYSHPHSLLYFFLFYYFGNISFTLFSLVPFITLIFSFLFLFYFFLFFHLIFSLLLFLSVQTFFLCLLFFSTVCIFIFFILRGFFSLSCYFLS